MRYLVSLNIEVRQRSKTPRKNRVDLAEIPQMVEHLVERRIVVALLYFDKQLRMRLQCPSGAAEYGKFVSFHVAFDERDRSVIGGDHVIETDNGHSEVRAGPRLEVSWSCQSTHIVNSYTADARYEKARFPPSVGYGSTMNGDYLSVAFVYSFKAL